jgi:serine/threonine protein phosphatase PrpC
VILCNDESSTPIKCGPIVGASMTGKKPRYPSLPNQDVLAIASCPPSAAGSAVLAIVCDGHGKFGHNVSRFVRDKLLQELLPKVGNMGNMLPADIARLHQQAYNNTSHDLLYSSSINSQFSGTTVSTAALVAGYSKLVVSHVGDSRVVLGKLSAKRDRVIAIDLAHDHKPDLPKEQARIAAKGGVVSITPTDSNGNPIGSSRVWRRGLRGPGLAMSRSLGDGVAHSIGVSGDPDVTCIQLGFPDMFVIIASDGIWEFISSQEAVDIVMATCAPELKAIAQQAKTQQQHQSTTTADEYNNNFAASNSGRDVGDASAGAEATGGGGGGGLLVTGPQTEAAVMKLCAIANQRWRSFSANTTVDDITCAVILLPRKSH